MKVKFTAYHAVAEWKWNLPAGSDDTCGICRVQFEGTCAKCKYPGDDCPISIGECTHCFHMHCIGDWLQSDASQGRCPMCRQVFREKVAPATGNANTAAAAAATTIGNGNGAAAATPRTPATAQQAPRRQQRNSGGSGRSQ